MKFQFGDLTEEYILFLAELAGHKVEGRQDESEIAGIKGHRDAVIDGVLVDVKSASSYSFKKFKEGLTEETDAFGYIPQLQSYLHAAQDDPLVTVKDMAAFLVFDKQHGHLCLDIHKREDRNWIEFYEERKRLVNSDQIPLRKYSSIPEGKSGNEKLGTNCSYCEMRNVCWDNKIRTFAYSGRPPIMLIKTIKVPNVPEIK
jgi:CRISPR/Cas system-associated exonuclease Cas4 (RecB family)